MKTLILYKSKTGNTKAYAERIGEGIHGDVFPLDKFKWRNLGGYDAIVFGGWIMGNTIQGIDKFLQHWKEMATKNVFVFAVGMSLPTTESRHLLIEQNILDNYHIRFYQFQGSFDMSKLRFPYNLLIANSIRATVNSPGASPEQKALADLKDHPFVFFDNDKVERVLLVLRTLSAELDCKEAK
ncbi:MAG: flavodoxin domain-containing protein [Bacilli bacterium]|jgi:menaquinone-dependent protoporphyrinogen IX oxidase|nr:flavodoxin domain-containing protein [Bacilli bacterium]